MTESGLGTVWRPATDTSTRSRGNGSVIFHTNVAFTFFLSPSLFPLHPPVTSLMNFSRAPFPLARTRSAAPCRVLFRDAADDSAHVFRKFGIRIQLLPRFELNLGIRSLN